MISYKEKILCHKITDFNKKGCLINHNLEEKNELIQNINSN